MDISPEDINNSPSKQLITEIRNLSNQVNGLHDAVNTSVERMNDLIARNNAITRLLIDKELVEEKELENYILTAKNQIVQEIEDAKRTMQDLEVFSILMENYVEKHDVTPEA